MILGQLNRIGHGVTVLRFPVDPRVNPSLHDSWAVSSSFWAHGRRFSAYPWGGMYRREGSKYVPGPKRYNLWSDLSDDSTFCVCNRVELGDPMYNFSGLHLKNIIMTDSRNLPPPTPNLARNGLKPL